MHPVVVVVIDECQAYLDGKSFPTKESKAVGAEIDSIVRDLVKRGRSAGIIVILSTQRPTADSIPTSTRDNCGLRVCFSVRTRGAAAAVLVSSRRNISPVGAPTGVGVSSIDGVEVRFGAPFVPDSVLRGHLGGTAAHAVPRSAELLKIDQVADRLKVSVGCIRAWRLKGEGPPAIRIGTALRWDSAEVDAWLDSRRESRMGC